MLLFLVDLRKNDLLSILIHKTRCQIPTRKGYQISPYFDVASCKVSAN